MSLEEYRRNGRVLTSSTVLTPAQQETLVDMTKRRATKLGSSLEGRAELVIDNVDGLGRLAVKSYRRGGLLRRFNSTWHFGAGASRAQVEFERLLRAREVGVRVPEPLAYVKRGVIFYRAWLVMRAIDDHQTLSSLSQSDPSAADEKLLEVSEQVVRLIENKIFHVDLHPGNVLVGAQGEVFIIDFDKASDFQGRMNELRDKYLRRWRRAVIKHQLPEVLSERFCSLVRRNFDSEL